MEKLYKDPRLSKKVDFGYTKLDLNNIPQTWIKIWNLISTKSLKCFVKSHQHPENFKNSKKHLLETLAEHKNYDLIYKLNNCLYTNSFRKDLHKEFFEIYTVKGVKKPIIGNSNDIIILFLVFFIVAFFHSSMEFIFSINNKKLYMSN